LDPCVYDVFESESALELNPEVVTLTPGTLCICYLSKYRYCIGTCVDRLGKPVKLDN